jgi:hypothetical protein
VPGDGLKGCYYNNENLNPSWSSVTATCPGAATRIDKTINFDWGTGSAISGLSADYISIMWRGYVMPKCTGQYTFYASANAGERAYVNAITVFDNWSTHTVSDSSFDTTLNTVYLYAGKKAGIRVDFHDHNGSASMRMYWDGPSANGCLSGTRQIVPQAVLYSK